MRELYALLGNTFGVCLDLHLGAQPTATGYFHAVIFSAVQGDFLSPYGQEGALWRLDYMRLDAPSLFVVVGPDGPSRPVVVPWRLQ